MSHWRFQHFPLEFWKGVILSKSIPAHICPAKFLMKMFSLRLLRRNLHKGGIKVFCMLSTLHPLIVLKLDLMNLVYWLVNNSLILDISLVTTVENVLAWKLCWQFWFPRAIKQAAVKCSSVSTVFCIAAWVLREGAGQHPSLSWSLGLTPCLWLWAPVLT